MSHFEQKSPEWFEQRVGKITASRAKACLDFLKSGKEGAERKKLRRALAGERVTGQQAPVFVNQAMIRGTELEPEARRVYELETGAIVEETGFWPHPLLSYAGASPDGLVGTNGLLEIKCPALETHIGYIEDGVVPEDYKPQMALQMASTGREWVDFCSYYPGLPPFIIRWERDDSYIEQLELAIVKLNDEVNELVAKIKGIS